MPDTKTDERRVIQGEMRVDRGASSPRIVGYAAVFNRTSEELYGFREQIAPGAFADVLPDADVRALINHDSNLILGRVPSTLSLAEDRKGLRVVIDPDPEISYVRDLLRSMERGDVDQMSFAFRVADGGDSWEQEPGELPMRTVNRVSALLDVSPVTYAAYPDTEVAVRGLRTFRTAQAAQENGSRQRRLLAAQLAMRR